MGSAQCYIQRPQVFKLDQNKSYQLWTSVPPLCTRHLPWPWDLQLTPRGPSASVWPKVCFYSIPPENLQQETTQWLEDNLIFVPCETSLEWHSYTYAPGKMGHIWLVVLAFTALAPALHCSSSLLHVAMRPAPFTCINTPHLCNTAKQLPCAWSKHVLDRVQSSFVQRSLRWVSSDIAPPWYRSIKKSYPGSSEME